jgi:hypothetical protein
VRHARAAGTEVVALDGLTAALGRLAPAAA